MTFSLNDIPDLSGKTAIVTGSTAGVNKIPPFFIQTLKIKNKIERTY